MAAGSDWTGEGRVVALVIPALNEASHIGALLTAMRGQAPDRVAEIIVADGGSTDETANIVRAAARDDPRVRLIHNPGRIQSAGVNLAVAAAADRVTTIVRVDAHAHYPDDFIAALLDEQARSGAASVVNRMRSVGSGCFQRAVAAASNSPIGTGGAAHRIGGEGRFIDHGHHALIDRAAFSAIGGYDESFVANEDAEFDYRLRASGRRIWFTTRATIDYFPRSTVGALARQYFRYGRGRSQNWRKHGERLRLRQMVPTLVTLALPLALAALTLTPWVALVPAAYVGIILLATADLLRRDPQRCVVGAAVALPTMHLAWGTGFIVETLIGRR